MSNVWASSLQYEIWRRKRRSQLSSSERLFVNEPINCVSAAICGRQRHSLGSCTLQQLHNDVTFIKQSRAQRNLIDLTVGVWVQLSARHIHHFCSYGSATASEFLKCLSAFFNQPIKEPGVSPPPYSLWKGHNNKLKRHFEAFSQLVALLLGSFCEYRFTLVDQPGFSAKRHICRFTVGVKGETWLCTSSFMRKICPASDFSTGFTFSKVITGSHISWMQLGSFLHQN